MFSTLLSARYALLGNMPKNSLSGLPEYHALWSAHKREQAQKTMQCSFLIGYCLSCDKNTARSLVNVWVTLGWASSFFCKINCKTSHSQFNYKIHANLTMTPTHADIMSWWPLCSVIKSLCVITLSTGVAEIVAVNSQRHTSYEWRVRNKVTWGDY